MAKISDLPSEHRSLGERIPADLLEKLSAEELRHRVAHVARIEGDADRTADRDAANGLNSLASSMLHAMPRPEYQAELERLDGSIDGAVNPEVRSGYYQALAKLKHDNAYPPGPVVPAQKAAKPKATAKSSKADIQKAVERELAKAVAEHQRKIDQLRAEIQEFKRERGI